MDPEEYDRFVASPFIEEKLTGDAGVDLIVIRGEADEIADPGSLPVVVSWVGDELGGAGPAAADVVVGESELDHLADLVGRRPLAATTYVTLLRAGANTQPDSALALESAAYSLLQGGSEFAAWRSDAVPRIDLRDRPVVSVDRDGSELVIELDRPDRHNAVTAQLRDELCAALAIARLDDSIARVVLRGRGPSFCSGGDLAEFGARADPVSAHRIRLARSPARSLALISPRLTARVHGATFGGGLEMAAFARRVIAHPNTRFGLPEIALGLIPGAGGTVSVPRRIGRQRAAALALATDGIGVRTALLWGLVDDVDGRWSG